MAKTFEEMIDCLKKLEDRVLDRRVMLHMGKLLREIVYKRTKVGKGVDSTDSSNPNIVTLAALSPNYIKFRQRAGVRGKFGSPAFSNLTFTGELLDTLTVLTARGAFGISFSDSVRKDGSGQTNAEVGRRLAEGDSSENLPPRKIMNITQAEKRILEKEIVTILEKEFNRLCVNLK